ncbi:MAG TPA: hypothetical protein VMU13_00115 [Candidatus Paceibacterota bacterium]|nr:hypothetical protein [Candidatus Paceibacterota bacterium]
MSKHENGDSKKTRPFFVMTAVGVVVTGIALFAVGYTTTFAFLGSRTPIAYLRAGVASSTATSSIIQSAPVALDVAAYNAKLLQLANYKTPLATSITVQATSTRLLSQATSTATSTTTTVVSKHRLWPANAAVPLPGALLPFNRIVAYYGNFYSTGMGVLGEYPEDQVLAMLASTTAMWRAADPSTPVIPAIDYIAVTAQASPGADGKYRARMPDSQIQKAIDMATQAHGIVFLDVQVGLSNVQTEVPLLEKYLKLPQVELCIDPEFAMQTSGMRPGSVIGTLDASDINFVSHYLAGLVTQYNLPPKILVVHRFTEDMVTNYKEIKTVPQVQFVMDMDGWGSQAKKIGTYTNVIYAEPVQFTGFKLFYKNDIKPPSTGMLSPTQILSFIPQPSFIQYQ